MRAYLLSLFLLGSDIALAKPEPTIPPHGSAEAGRKLFLGNTLMCSGCHSIDPSDEGQDYPNLAKVGARLNRDQIISSILEPSLDFAEGFHQVLVELKDPDEDPIRGVEVESQSNENIFAVRISNGTTLLLERQSIASIKSGQSPMPKGTVDDLKDQEFYDLVAFLMSLK